LIEHVDTVWRRGVSQHVKNALPYFYFITEGLWQIEMYVK